MNTTSNEAADIATKWAKRIGLGFHPDTRGKDYGPRLSQEEVRDYDADMDRLFEVAADPYEAAIDAWKREGLI